MEHAEVWSILTITGHISILFIVILPLISLIYLIQPFFSYKFSGDTVLLFYYCCVINTSIIVICKVSVLGCISNLNSLGI